MRNLIKLNRLWRRKKFQQQELEAVRNEALTSIADALAKLSDRLVEIGLPPASLPSVSTAAAKMREAVLDFTDGHETGLAIDCSQAKAEIDAECAERGLHVGRTLNSLQNAEHMRARVRATIGRGRESVESGLMSLYDLRRFTRHDWQHYRRHMARAFQPAEQPAAPPELGMQRFFDTLMAAE